MFDMMNLTLPLVYVYLLLQHRSPNVNATYSHQRPPSVGMPRHALRRRMPNSATGRPHCPLGAGISIRSSKLRVWVGPLARSCVWGFPTSKSRSDFRDLVNYPNDLAEIWHTAPLEHSKNKSLLTFCPLNIFCWSKMRFSDKIFDFFHFTVYFSPQGHASYPKPC